LVKDFEEIEDILYCSEISEPEKCTIDSYVFSTSFVKTDNMSKKIDNIRKRAEEGDADAMNEMGVLYHNGQGVEQDFKEALEWYWKAVDKDNIDAWVNLGILYNFGQGVERNFNHATTLHIKAAIFENKWATKNIIFYPKVKGTTPNLKEAMAWFKEAAEHGDAGAMNNVGLLYEARGIEEWDRKEAITWYKKAADLGNADAMYRLGSIYEHGIFMEKREFEEEAASWYKKAAELGNADAMCRIGSNLYSKEQEQEEAISWFRKAADLGNTNAMVALGVFCPMMKKTGPYFKWNVGWRVPNGYINDQGGGVRVGFGSYSTDRMGTEQSYKEAMSWFRKAADFGNTWAMLNISTLYYNGLGVEKDYREAATWARKAIDLNNFYSIGSVFGYIWNDYRKVELSDDWKTIIWMGLIEFNDQGTEKSYIESMSWFRKAADLGSASAMNHIGMLYDCGLGVKKDYNEAMSWYRKALYKGA